MSQEVLEGQQWLNSTYGSRAGYIRVKEDGLPGTAMSQALVSAMQIELGLGTITGVFGDQSMTACDASPLSAGSTGNRVKILQYGLFSKGYNPGSASGTYTPATESAVERVQTDAGLSGSQVSGTAKGMQVKAVLGVDEYKLIPGGDTQVREIQQKLNRQYLDYSGLCAADGVYGRSTATQLIYALQAEEGLPIGVANGNFGPTTQTWCPDLGTSTPQYGYGNVQYSSAALLRFQTLAEYALYCVGIDRYSGGTGSKYNPYIGGDLWTALNAFQKDYGLTVRRMLKLDEWMGLLVSTGNPMRECPGCDCSTQLTAAKVNALVNDGYSIVGRYLTGTVGGDSNKRAKNLTADEVSVIKNGGMRIFCIFQDDEDWWAAGHQDLSGYFNYSRGFNDAKKAVTAARNLGVPLGEYIYFAVDYDYMEGEVWSRVVPHFEGIFNYMSQAGHPYNIGIYSARNTCGIVSAQGLASSSFVSDMSTGYSGNLGYPLPSNWAFDQVLEYTLNASDGSFGVDKNAVSGRYQGFNTLTEQTPTYEVSATETGVISNAVGALTAKVGASIALEYYGETATSSTYRTGFASVANIVENSGMEAKCIQYVKIEVIGADGVTFELADPSIEMANYPSVDKDSSNVVAEKIVESFYGVAKTAISNITKANLVVSLFFKALEFAGELDSNPPASNSGDSYLVRTYKWNELQQETSQAMIINPKFPNNGKGAFKVRYTVHCNPGGDAVSVEITEKNRH